MLGASALFIAEVAQILFIDDYLISSLFLLLFFIRRTSGFSQLPLLIRRAQHKRAIYVFLMQHLGNALQAQLQLPSIIPNR